MTISDTASTPAIRAARSHPGAILTIILVSYFMIVLDNSIVFTGLASIGRLVTEQAVRVGYAIRAPTNLVLDTEPERFRSDLARLRAFNEPSLGV